MVRTPPLIIGITFCLCRRNIILFYTTSLTSAMMNTVNHFLYFYLLLLSRRLLNLIEGKLFEWLGATRLYIKACLWDGKISWCIFFWANLIISFPGILFCWESRMKYRYIHHDRPRISQALNHFGILSLGLPARHHLPVWQSFYLVTCFLNHIPVRSWISNSLCNAPLRLEMEGADQVEIFLHFDWVQCFLIGLRSSRIKKY